MSNARSPLILIVEDNRVEAELHARLLRSAGYETQLIADAEGVLEVMIERPPVLVLLDVMLPKLNGYELCRMIKADKRLAEIPVIMLTGLDDVDSISDAYAAGASEYITKPVRAAHLVHRVDSVAERNSLNFPPRDNEQRQRQQSSQRMGRFSIGCDQDYLQLSDELATLFESDGHCPLNKMFSHIHSEDHEHATHHLQAVRDGQPGAFFEIRIRLPGDRFRHTEIYLDRFGDGKDATIQGLAVDVSARKNRESEAMRLAYFDHLTLLPNRSFLEKYLDGALKVSVQRGYCVAAINVDLDLFSRINQGLGHEAGDDVIRQAAKRLVALAGVNTQALNLIWEKINLNPAGLEGFDGDLVASMGGDSFMVLLVGVEQNAWQLNEFADRIHSAFGKPFYFLGRELFCTASVGIALSERNTAAADLVQQADIAVHEAKRAGRNKTIHFAGTQAQSAAESLALQADMRQAINSEQFEVYYQPKTSLQKHALSGFEALIRWPHPGRGHVAPNILIELAEETGQIVEIGDWVLHRACKQLADWRAQGLTRGTMAVNVSVRQLRDSRFIDVVDHALDEAGLPGNALELEITENAFIEAEDCASTIRALQRRGISIALDDFGTGYSAMSYLVNFPINTLKIDRSFVRNVHSSEKKEAVVQALVSLSHAMDIKVVAEGIENQLELEAVRKLQCDEMQGYFVCRPLSAENMEVWLRESSSRHQLKLA